MSIGAVVDFLYEKTGIDLRSEAYIGYYLKKLTLASSISLQKQSKGYHLEVTGAEEAMLLFPMVTSSAYEASRESREKRRYYLQIGVRVLRENLISLAERVVSKGELDLKKPVNYFEEEISVLKESPQVYINTHSTCTFAVRDTGQKQIEIGTSSDGDEFLFLRYCLLPDDYILFLQRSAADYDVVGITKEDKEGWNFPDFEVTNLSERTLEQKKVKASWVKEEILDSYSPQKQKSTTALPLPKPFLLLAGISGTGKTRFVRKQAELAAGEFGLKTGDNHCLVPVRPDWHEPSDLLGYISRIGGKGARYVTTELLHFMVTAWKHAVVSASADGAAFKQFDSVCPYWLCLDEMNLAPVEQYFADYLSVLEDRRWEGGSYYCPPLLSGALIRQQLDPDGLMDLWQQLGIAEDAGLQAFFTEKGIPLPPNLIVAGTVNMDETTHGFSRKVIDRALTLDFGEFFPNDYGQFFEADKRTSPRLLGFPRYSAVPRRDLLAGVPADPDGSLTTNFLSEMNAHLKGTPFELAYRALNEALLMVLCFLPSDGQLLQSVWDDFVMMKVLPRIEGDTDRLDCGGDSETSLLTCLADCLKLQLPLIVSGRPDLLNLSPDGSLVPLRSVKKLEWMQKRLLQKGFTSFWP